VSIVPPAVDKAVYLRGIPAASRVAKGVGFLTEVQLPPACLAQIRQLNVLALERRQRLAQITPAWIPRDERVTSVLIGASKPDQLTTSLFCLDNLQFSEEKLGRVEQNLGAPEVAG
jgi:L-glyceraldehyde 3-phosphate reductase